MASQQREGLDSFKLTGIELTERELGTGSYASVFEVKYLGLKCAGKKIHELLLRQGGGVTYAVRRFDEECRLLSQLRHPNIVQFLGVYTERGMQAPILVMEFLPENLTSCVETHLAPRVDGRHSNLHPEISYSILHDVALGLNYLHNQVPPIIHRDLSSNNVLLASNMKAKISDLGVAKMLDLSPLQVSRVAFNTQTPGTPAYMPPEAMISNPTYDVSIDVFSFGVMIIHVFSGKWPEPQGGQIRIERGKMIPVSEAERREVYLRVVGDRHPLMDLVLRCIDNDVEVRPAIGDVLVPLSNLVSQNSLPLSNHVEMLQGMKVQQGRIEDLQQQIHKLQMDIEASASMHSVSVTSLPNPSGYGPCMACRLPGCTRPRYRDPANGRVHEYCGRTHATEARKLGIVPINSNNGVRRANQSEFSLVSQKFTSSWKKGSCPKVDFVYVVYNSALESRWTAYKQQLRDQTVEEHYHGTKLTCDLSNAPCTDQECGICGISSRGFDRRCIRKNINYHRFGLAFYLAPHSSKCHDYTQGAHGYRAMLLCSVCPGTKYNLLRDNVQLKGPPKGYDCVFGQVGQSLNYEEIAIHNPDAIVPRYIIVYQRDGVAKIAK